MSKNIEAVFFQRQLGRRLANNVVDALDVVHAKDPGFRFNFLEGKMRDAHTAGAEDVVSVLRVRTQRPGPSGEGVILLRLGMGTSRIVQLINEKLMPAD